VEALWWNKVDVLSINADQIVFADKYVVVSGIMLGGARFGVYVPEDLLSKLDQCARSLGIGSRSRLVQEALRLLVSEYGWRGSGRSTGIIGVVYNHEVEGVDEALTDVQHGFLDVIVAVLHVHLDREKCLLAIVVKGDSSRIKRLLSKLLGLKGVLTARPLLLEAQPP